MSENIISRQTGSLLKGMAIIMIIVQHLGQAYKIGFINPLGPIGVFIFLFMSGYGLTYSYNKSGRKCYFRKRFFKVYCLYLFSLLIFLALHIVMFNETFTIDKIINYAVLRELPQGSHWYLLLMFLWYVVFWLYTFCIDTRFEIAGLFIATVVVLAIMGGNKSVVWQICSFQLGVITALYGSKIIEWINPRRKWGGLFLIAIALIAVALKKTEYVETHELGMVDTFLQIILTQAVGVLCIIYADFVQKIKASKLLIICGDVSYELYLAHVIMLNWLKEKPIVSVLIEYIIISVFVCIVLVAIRKLIMEGVLKNVWGNKQKG